MSRLMSYPTYWQVVVCPLSRDSADSKLTQPLHTDSRQGLNPHFLLLDVPFLCIGAVGGLFLGNLFMYYLYTNDSAVSVSADFLYTLRLALRVSADPFLPIMPSPPKKPPTRTGPYTDRRGRRN